MFIVSTRGEQGIIANKDRVRIDGNTVVNEQVRKKARHAVSDSPGSKNSNTTISLHVDVNASPLICPQRDSGFRRSPIAAVGNVAIADEISDVVENEEPFVIARKLLRRRHVRKIRKEREYQKAKNTRETRERRYRRQTQNTCGSRSNGMRDHFVAHISLPQLSPMLIKSDSFSDVTQGTPTQHAHYNGNEPWIVEREDSPKAINLPMGESSVTPDTVPVAFISFPRKSRPMSMSRISFSPLRPRNNM